MSRALTQPGLPTPEAQSSWALVTSQPRCRWGGIHGKQLRFITATAKEGGLGAKAIVMGEAGAGREAVGMGGAWTV